MQFDNLSMQSDEDKKNVELKVENLEKDDSKEEIKRNESATSRVTQRFSRNTTLRKTEVLTRDSFTFVKKLGEGAYGLV